MKKFYPVSLVIFFGLIVTAIVLSGFGLALFPYAPALIVVVGMPAALLFATHSPREMGNAFRSAYRSSDPVELRVAIGLFSAMQRYLLWSGLLATMIGVIGMLASLGDTNSIGMGGALALITVFYSIILNLVLALPFRHAAEKRLAQVG